jgi:hypothetical protein
MSEKSHAELLLETLEKSAKEVASWPPWMRKAMSNASILQFASLREQRERAQANAQAVDDPHDR